MAQKQLKKVQKSLMVLEEDLDQFDEEFLELQSIMETNDNLSHKNVQLQRLKEGAEGDNLVTYLENLFSACLGVDSDIEVKIVKAR